MDPNAALAACREAVQEIDDSNAVDGVDLLSDNVRKLVEHYKALDEWLGKGGFLPEAWNRQTLIWTLEGATLTNLKYDCTARRLRVSVDWGTFKWDADNTGWTAGIDPDRRVQ